MNWQLVFNTLVALIVALGGWYSTRQIRRGNDADRAQKAAEASRVQEAAALAAEQADRKESFAQVSETVTILRGNLNYYLEELDRARAEAKKARVEKDELQAEWIQRHGELLDRCAENQQRLRDLLSMSLSPQQRTNVERAIAEAESHLAEDHQWYDNQKN